MYNLLKENRNSARVNIDLRHELNSLKGEFSFRVLYIRNCKYVKCDCYDSLNKSGTPECPKCFGSGYFASIEKIDVINSSLGGYSGGDTINKKTIGMVDQKEEVYYVDYKVLPKTRDYILKVTWKKDTPVDVVEVLEVINPYEMRGDGGRIESFGIQVKKRADLTNQYNKTLKELPVKALQVLSKGGKYLWPYKLLSQKNEEV